MRRCVRWVVVCAAVALVGVGTASAQGDCDRACLKALLDQYLNAVVKHDPAAAPLVVGFRQTENAINVRPGTGVWKTVTALGKLQRRYVDPVSGQAGYYGTIEEGSTTAVVTVRLRVEKRKLTEAEWYLARPDDPGLQGARQPGRGPANNYNADYLIANPPPDRVVPRAQRLGRDELINVVNSYFDAITSHDGSVALTQPGCGRLENGGPAPAGRFLPPLSRAGGAGPAGTAPPPPGGGANDCVSGLQNFNLSMVVARRIPLVDEEQQMVLGMAVFIRRPGSPTPRNVFSEWFMVDEGKIKLIWTAMFYPAPELAVPNWPPYDGNWPLPASTIPAPPAPPQGR
jgi:hypothetical protein